jgi:hypothetical protein
MAGIYRQRHPERTVFSRVMFHYFEEFVSEYENRFRERVWLLLIRLKAKFAINMAKTALIIFFVNTSLLPISLCLTTKFLYDIDCKGCQRAEIG